MLKVSKLALACGLALATSSQVNAELIGHWTFDADNGTVLDSSGNGYVGDIVNTVEGATNVTYGAGVNGGKAIYFDGAGYVTTYAIVSAVPYSKPLALEDTSFTIAYWAKQTVGGSLQVPICGFDNGINNVAGYSFVMMSNGQFRYVFNSAWTDNSQNVDLAAINGNDLLNQWAHYAMVYDKAIDQVSIYLNGELKATFGTSGPLSDDGSSRPLVFGAYSVLRDEVHGTLEYNYFYQGALDDIRIYNNVMSASDIQGIMVPEPAMVSVLGAGLLGLMYRGRKQA